MNVLLAVASKHGSTRDIADAIADELRSAGLTIDLRNVADVESIAAYDAVVFGSAIYAGNWLPEAKRFAERFHAELATLPVWVWSSGPLGSSDPQPHDDPRRLAAPLNDLAVRDHRIFAGKLDREHLGFAERIIAKVVQTPYGDFRDWDGVRAWAHEIAATLMRVETPVASTPST